MMKSGNHDIRRRLWRNLVMAGCLMVLGLSLAKMARGENADPSAGIIGSERQPTCTESGYRAIEEQGAIHFETIPPLGHSFDEWKTDGDGIWKTHICQRCGYEEKVRVSTVAEETLPRLYLTGGMDGIGKKSRVTLEADFASTEENFQCYGIMTLQGHSTFGLPKKNYTIRFYDDTEGNSKHKIAFRDWRKEHKYILKANYADISQCRNLVAAGIWREMIKSRENVPQRILDLPTYGTVDGFPVAVYLNGDFFGLYTLNLHKDDDLYHMKEGNREALIICNAQTMDESLFRETAAFSEDYSSDWEIEFCGTEDESWAMESFNQLITFVMESSDEDFRLHLQDYMDVDAAVDYLLFIYAMGLPNSGAKDLVMLSYGEKWIPSAFDMDEAFGLDPAHGRYRDPLEFLPALTGGPEPSGTNSLLWDRMLVNFQDRLRTRYFALRQSVFSDDFMINRVKDFIAQIPESFYDFDLYLYPERAIKDIRMEEQIIQYIRTRMKILDYIWGGFAE